SHSVGGYSSSSPTNHAPRQSPRSQTAGHQQPYFPPTLVGPPGLLSPSPLPHQHSPRPARYLPTPGHPSYPSPQHLSPEAACAPRGLAMRVLTNGFPAGAGSNSSSDSGLGGVGGGGVFSERTNQSCSHSSLSSTNESGGQSRPGEMSPFEQTMPPDSPAASFAHLSTHLGSLMPPPHSGLHQPVAQHPNTLSLGNHINLNHNHNHNHHLGNHQHQQHLHNQHQHQNHHHHQQQHPQHLTQPGGNHHFAHSNSIGGSEAGVYGHLPDSASSNSHAWPTQPIDQVYPSNQDANSGAGSPYATPLLTHTHSSGNHDTGPQAHTHNQHNQHNQHNHNHNHNHNHIHQHQNHNGRQRSESSSDNAESQSLQSPEARVFATNGSVYFEERGAEEVVVSGAGEASSGFPGLSNTSLSGFSGSSPAAASSPLLLGVTPTRGHGFPTNPSPTDLPLGLTNGAPGNRGSNHNGRTKTAACSRLGFYAGSSPGQLLGGPARSGASELAAPGLPGGGPRPNDYAPTSASVSASASAADSAAASLASSDGETNSSVATGAGAGAGGSGSGGGRRDRFNRKPAPTLATGRRNLKNEMVSAQRRPSLLCSSSSSAIATRTTWTCSLASATERVTDAHRVVAEWAFSCHVSRDLLLSSARPRGCFRWLRCLTESNTHLALILTGQCRSADTGTESRVMIKINPEWGRFTELVGAQLEKVEVLLDSF
ncbi:unnamed protein product, partial [Protopolystoma xenopodis]